MKKPIVIQENEEFVLHNRVFVYSVKDGNISLRQVRIEDAPPTVDAKSPKKRTTKIQVNPPKLEEVIAFFKEKGYSEDAAKRFYGSYENGNPPWHDSQGKPVIAWKQKAYNVWFKPENKDKIQEQKKGGSFFKENI